MISGNYSNYNNQPNNVSYGAVKDVVPQNINQKLPENLQNLDAKEVATNNGAVASVGNINGKTALLTLPFYATFVGLRSINDKANIPFSFAGEYDKTFLGKLAKLGDKITGLVSKIIPDGIEEAIPRKAKQAKDFVQNHSAVARSLSTPLTLEHSMAISEANGLFGRVIFDDATLFEKGFKGTAGDLINMFKGDGTSRFWQRLVSKGIESADDIAANKIVQEALKDLGNGSIRNPEIRECATDIINALSNSNATFTISKWGRLPVGKIPLLGKALTLEVPATEIANKLRVAANVSPNELKVAGGAAAVGTTALGRALPNAFAKAYEGLTSDFVGGKLAPVLQAYFLASAAMRAKDAPKGTRLATFMDEEVGGVATLFTLPLATALVTKLGGLKYLGMGKTVQEQETAKNAFRKAVEVLNGKIDAGTITRGEYLDEVKKVKNMLKGDVKWYQKPFKWLGRIVGGNYKAETIKPFLEDVSESANISGFKKFGMDVLNKVKSLGYKFNTKGVLGFTPAGTLRFILAMFVFSPIVTKPIRWVVNKIFGKPYDPAKEKEEQAKKAQEEAAKNNPFATMNDEELITLLSKNQDTLEAIQNDPKLMQELQANPQKLYEILKEGAAKKDEALKNAAPSPALQSYINRVKNGQNAQAPNVQNPQMAQATPVNNNPFVKNNQQNSPIASTQTAQNNGALNQSMDFNSNATMPAPSIQQTETKAPEVEDKPFEPQRNYIPSSKPADFSAQKNAADAKFNALLNDMDKTEQYYNQYLGI